MKNITTLFVLLFSCVVAFGNSIAVSPMKKVPHKVISFANELYAEIRIDKELVQQFLDQGVAKQELSEEEKKYDKEGDVRKDAEGMMMLHGCSGVFTDESGLVYFWVLSSPRV